MRFAALLLLASVVALPATKPAYVAVEKISGHLGFFDADGARLKEVKLGGHPHEMAFSPDGRYVYVTDNGVVWMTEGGQGGNTVSIIDVKAQAKTGVIDLGKYRRPHGIDVDRRTGHVLVTTELPSALLLTDPKARTVLKTYDVRGEAPHMVALDRDSVWAYVSNTNTGTLAAINIQTSETKVIPIGERPQGAVFSPDFKRLYVTNLGSNAISVIDTAAKAVIGEIRTGQGPCRAAVTVDGKTIIYALQTGEAVGFADTAALKEEAQVKLTGQPVSLTLSSDRKQAFSSVQSQDKVFVISIRQRKIDRVISTPKDSGPDPFLPLP